MAVVSPRQALEIIMVVVLGWAERRRVGDLGHDRLRPAGLVALDGALGGFTLLIIVYEDRRAVLRADVVHLAVLRRRIVQPEEEVEDLVVADLLRIEADLHRLGVAGRSLLPLLVRRVLERAAGVPGGRLDHTRQLADQLLDPPQAAAGQRGGLRHFSPPFPAFP